MGKELVIPSTYLPTYKKRNGNSLEKNSVIKQVGKEGQNCEEGNFFSSSLSSIHENQQSDEKHNRKSSDTGTLLGTENFNSMANGKVFFVCNSVQ